MAKTTSSESLLHAAQSWQRRFFGTKSQVKIDMTASGFFSISVIYHYIVRYSGVINYVEDPEKVEWELSKLNDVCNIIGKDIRLFEK